MKTTKQWWDEVSKDPNKFIEWLKKQYHGERTAASRITKLANDIPFDDKREWRRKLLMGIVVDEAKHATWIGRLLSVRGIEPKLLEKEERYWNETLPVAEGKSFEYLCAVGHLAEAMRLDRITLLSTDSRYKDVAEVFAKILPDEEFHVKIFGILSNEESIQEARKYHNNGMNAIGLVA